MAPQGADTAANLAKAEQYCRRAAAQGADIALMPEMWSIGYPDMPAGDSGAIDRVHALALATESSEIQRFSTLAALLNMAIGVTYLQAWDPAPRNALTLFDRHGNEVFTYAKVHTSDFNPLEAATTPGESFHVAALDTARGTVSVGAMICFDREQPESARILMLQGAEVILTPNACNLDSLRLDQFRIRAWENCVAVAMTNYARPRFNGRSVAFDAAGNRRLRARGGEGVYIAEFDIAALRARREKTIWGNAYRRPQRYGILTAPEKATVWERKERENQ